MDEIASISKAAETFLRKCMASLRFIRAIGLHIYPELFRPVCKLTLTAIGTITFFCEIFAERAFGFGGGVVEGEKGQCGEGWIKDMLVLVRLCGGV